MLGVIVVVVVVWVVVLVDGFTGVGDDGNGSHDNGDGNFVLVHLYDTRIYHEYIIINQ